MRQCVNWSGFYYSTRTTRKPKRQPRQEPDATETCTKDQLIKQSNQELGGFTDGPGIAGTPNANQEPGTASACQTKEHSLPPQ